MTMIRVAIISHKYFTDYLYLQQQLLRLASLYHEVVIIHGGEPVRYGMFLHQWVKDHPENFSDVVCRKDVFKYGAGPAGLEQAREMLDAEPDEVWKFETSPKSKCRPLRAIFPEFWYSAACEGVTLRVFRAPFRKSKYTGRLYEQETNEDGFPQEIVVREWDTEAHGLRDRSGDVQKYSNNPASKARRERRRRTGKNDW